MLEITKAIIIQSQHTDKVILETNLPCQYSKEYLKSQPNLTLSFDTPQNTGVEYVRQNFGVEIEIIKKKDY